MVKTEQRQCVNITSRAAALTRKSQTVAAPFYADDLDESDEQGQ